MHSTTGETDAAGKSRGMRQQAGPRFPLPVLSRLPAQDDPNLLVGFETSDDAGMYRIAPDVALVQTVDFFTPLVDDPFTFGQIAATNALSDVYAMGGRPLTALASSAFPRTPIWESWTDHARRPGKNARGDCVVVGGHSVRDAEMKFGYAVTGLIDPDPCLPIPARSPAIL